MTNPPQEPSKDTSELENKLIERHIKVKLDYAPTTNGKKARAWFESHGMDFFGVGRRAWCSQYSTYFRDALGVAYTESGESFLFYQEDLVESALEQEEKHD